MSQEQWSAVDRYISGQLVPADPILDAALQTTSDAGMPSINIAPNQGKLLHLLAVVRGAETILEVGTLGGYSTIWLARALPEDGRLITLEANPAHAAVARANVARADLGHIVDVRVGPALDTLPLLATEGASPFDVIFIDADKVNNPQYFSWALRLARRGSLIIVDNVVRKGAIIDATDDDPSIRGTRQLYEAVSTEPRVTATAVQTVGSKGYDGFLLALVTAEM